MSDTTPVTATVNGQPVLAYIHREAVALAPQLITFLATGLSASAVIYVLSLFGINISTTLATLLVAGVSAVAAFIKRDNLLGLDAKHLSGKLAVFILTGLSATVVTSILAALGIHFADWLPPLVATVAGIIAGYFKADAVAVTAN